METVKEWFGKGCEYLSALWENNDTPKDSEPVLQFCNHKDNPEDTEGNCRHNICPLLVAVFDESMRTEVDLRDVTIREVSKSMHLTDEQRRMLTEKLLEEPWENEMMCCRSMNRTFLTPQDLIDCKKALVKKGKWNKFRAFANNKWGEDEEETSFFPIWSGVLALDETGEAHFCRLVAEFMEVLK